MGRKLYQVQQSTNHTSLLSGRDNPRCQTQIKIHTDLTREDHLEAGRPEGKDTIEMYGTVLALSTATNLSPWRERTPKTIADRTLQFFFFQLHNSSSSLPKALS